MTDERFRVLIFGSRTWRDAGPIQAVLRQYATAAPDTLVIHGAAKGADSLADFYARALGLEVLPFPAKWQEHDDNWCPGDWCRTRHYCVAAGPRRNQQMLNEGQVNTAWGFVNKPLAESKGSADMLDRVRTHGVPWYLTESGQ